MTKDPIKQMRSYMFKNINHPHFVPMNVMLDEIEAAYMKLPVDADNVPIRPGDAMQMAFGESADVVAVDTERWFFDQNCLTGRSDDYDYKWAANSHHAKPDAVAEELVKFLWACGDDDPHYYDEQIEEFANRIRKAVEDGD